MPQPSDDTEDLIVDPAASEAAAGEEGGAEKQRFVISRDPQLRLDKYLQMRIKGISRNQVQKLIDLGGVSVNDKPVKPSTVIKRGDAIEVILPPTPAREITPEPIPLNILYEDRDFIVLNKQANLIVHPARSNLTGTLLNGLAHHFLEEQKRLPKAWPAPPGSFAAPGSIAPPKPWASAPDDSSSDQSPPDQPPQPAQGKLKGRHGNATIPAVGGLSNVGLDDCRPGVVHRLDRNTTGVIVVAKRDETHWAIAKQFENRTTLKCYLALVHGTPDPPDATGGVIDAPIGKHPTIREAMAVRHDSSARNAVTIWRVRKRYRGYTLVELELRTGRTHQIRVHLSYLGCPIVGDIIYGGEPFGPPEIDHPPLPGAHKRYLTFARTKDEGLKIYAAIDQRGDVVLAYPALHAALLRFRHPATHQPMTFTAPLHHPFKDVLQMLAPHEIEGPRAPDGWHVDLDYALG
jgi:23S rRNA pseudouridine1911/1915/1917 synthase